MFTLVPWPLPVRRTHRDARGLCNVGPPRPRTVARRRGRGNGDRGKFRFRVGERHPARPPDDYEYLNS